jgi:hypothetical protein
VIVMLTDGRVLTLVGTTVSDKHWIQVTSNKDADLTAKTQGRAFEIASYRYDEIFKPLEQLLESPPQKTPAASPKAESKVAPKVAPKDAPKAKPRPTGAATAPDAQDKPAPAATP